MALDIIITYRTHYLPSFFLRIKVIILEKIKKVI